MSAPMPAGFLTEHLIRSGYLTETGLSRRARLLPCSRCKALTLSGLDDDVCALEAVCDPRPLSKLGEALVLIEGRRTWSLRHRRRFELEVRIAVDIGRYPAGSQLRHDVLAEHVCGREMPPAYLADSTFPVTSTMPPGSPAPF